MKDGKTREGVLLSVIAMLLALAAGTGAQKEKTTASRNTSAPDRAEREATNGAPAKSEMVEGNPAAGIKVHGHWTIIVRNPDGSVASRHEFENSLMPGGQKFLASLLARQATPFNWAVALGSFCGTPATPKMCNLVEPAVANDATAVSFYGQTMVPVLSISAPTAGADAGKFIITGSVTAVVAGQVAWVQTGALSHSTSGLLITSFTSTNVAQQAIAVQAGQAIDVSVVISFS
jgi:hypothetical protein